jgi:AcrR family transcriptional regulator
MLDPSSFETSRENVLTKLTFFTRNVKLYDMSEANDPKREAILASSTTLFRRYGYRRTSMEDIAKETGVSRPSLYSHFANKDEVFRSLSMTLHENALAESERILQSDPDGVSIDDRLEGALAAKLGGVMTFGDESPHGNEICDEANRLCGDIVTDASSRFLAMLTSALRAASRRGEIELGGSHPTPAAAAELINLGAYGLIRGAADSATFYTRLRSFVQIFVAGMR